MTFITPTATTFTIRALHDGIHGAATTAKKTKGLVCSLVCAFLFKVVNIYAPQSLSTGVSVGLDFASIVDPEDYGRILGFTPTIFGAGMFSGLNAWSFRESLL